MVICDSWNGFNSVWFHKLENNDNFQCKWNTIDTVNDGAYITTERMDAFQFTNAFESDRLVAIYAQQRNQSKFVDFEGIAAGVSWDVYLFAIIICCLLNGLFAFIEHMRPFHSEFYFGMLRQRYCLVLVVRHQHWNTQIRRHAVWRLLLQHFCVSVHDILSNIVTQYPWGIGRLYAQNRIANGIARKPSLILKFSLLFLIFQH